MEFTFLDTLVLKIDEHDVDLNMPDTTLYVIYDKAQHNFIVRGKRRETAALCSCTYSFTCEYAKDLADFIQFLICKDNTVSYILYNYDNLPATSNEISFEFLLEHDDIAFEIAGYDNQALKRNILLKNLRMLRNVYNNYA
jgi:hypothetical protein